MEHISKFKISVILDVDCPFEVYPNFWLSCKMPRRISLLELGALQPCECFQRNEHRHSTTTVTSVTSYTYSSRSCGYRCVVQYYCVLCTWCSTAELPIRSKVQRLPAMTTYTSNMLATWLGQIKPLLLFFLSHTKLWLCI